MQQLVYLGLAFFFTFGSKLQQGLAREAFDEVLVLALPHHLDEVIRELFEDGHELGYAGPGDSEMVAC